MVQTCSLSATTRPRWIQRPAALPYLSEPVLSPVRPQVAIASILLNEQICLREIELEMDGDSPSQIHLPWVLVDDQHHTSEVLAFRSKPCQNHLESCLRKPDSVHSNDPGVSFVARWNLVVTDVQINPVESFWHDVVAIAKVCLNQELELSGIRICNDGHIAWPSAIGFADSELQRQIESAILRQLAA